MKHASTATTIYRSANIPSGFFRRIGSIHVHVDGAHRVQLLEAMVQSFEKKGLPGKLTAVGNAVAGPQRSSIPEVYEGHTPGSLGHEEFEFFSTTAVPDRTQAVLAIDEILSHVAKHPGMVVEAEQVVAIVEQQEWPETQEELVQPIKTTNLGCLSKASWPYEVHHAWDIPGGRDLLPSLAEIAEHLTDAGLEVGGLFTFMKGDSLSVRSSAFRRAKRLRESVLEEQALLRGFLQKSVPEFRLWSMVEYVIGIWKTPIAYQRSDAEEQTMINR